MVAHGLATPPRRLARLLRIQLRQELQLRYVGSVAGVYWSVINPLVQVAVYVILVTFILKANIPATQGGKFDYAIFVLAGMCPWLAIQDGLNNSASSLTRHASIVKNVVFPLELLPTTAVVASLAPLLVSLITLGFLLGIDGRSVGVSIVTLPLLMAVQLLFTLGFALFLSVATAFLRDLQFILPVVFQVVLLITPILYTAASLPHPLAELMRINPLTYIVDGVSRGLLRQRLAERARPPVHDGVQPRARRSGPTVFRRLKGYAEALV